MKVNIYIAEVSLLETPSGQFTIVKLTVSIILFSFLLLGFRATPTHCKLWPPAPDGPAQQDGWPRLMTSPPVPKLQEIAAGFEIVALRN